MSRIRYRQPDFPTTDIFIFSPFAIRLIGVLEGSAGGTVLFLRAEWTAALMAARERESYSIHRDGLEGETLRQTRRELLQKALRKDMRKL